MVPVALSSEGLELVAKGFEVVHALVERNRLGDFGLGMGVDPLNG